MTASTAGASALPSAVGQPAGLSLPALRGDAAVPPTKALPVVGEDEASTK